MLLLETSISNLTLHRRPLSIDIKDYSFFDNMDQAYLRQQESTCDNIQNIFYNKA
jgi:hypothetical protein